MLSFECDYNNGAAPKVLQAIIDSNSAYVPGYGFDEFTKRAEDKIKAAIGKSDVDIEFVNGGTQANQLVISTMLKDYEGVVAADTGHVNTHESGAIEYTGHKVMTIKNNDGKIMANALESFLSAYHRDGNKDAIVYPGMVYISHPTENGTLYSKKELEDLRKVTTKYSIPLFLDGARLSYGLESKETDVTISDIANLCDVFYIGGTKCGALSGEAIVFSSGMRPEHFWARKKQHGALSAKGRLLGVQFDALFTDGYYNTLGRHAIDMAERLKKILKDKGYEFYMYSPTNQQYVVVDNKKMKELEKSVRFGFWDLVDENHTAIRFCTSWSTTDEDLDELEKIL